MADQRSQRVFIIEDDPGVSEVVKLLLSREGYLVESSPSVKEGLRRLALGDFDLVITDLKLPDGTGLDAVRLIHEKDRALPIIMMTSYSSLESAIAALRAGAVDYIIKPFDNDELLHSVERALKERRLSRENAALRRALRSAYASRPILGESPGMQKALERMRKAAQSEANVLIAGEYGTGKELLAHALHARGPRADGPFVPVKCGALAPAVLEAELFGRVGGADAREGLIREAHGGTLYLDEISELSAALQAKLLRVLQDKVARSLGEGHAYAADVRFVAATHWDLEAAVAKGAFRQDLYYSLHVISLTLPPLRERGGDVLLLARHFAEHYSRKLGKRVRGFDAEFTSFLERHPWPGNVRELEHFIESAVIFADGDVLTGRDLAEVAPALPMMRAAPAAQGDAPPLAIEEYIREVVERFQDTRSEAELARMLGIGRKALWTRRRQWGMKRVRRGTS
jgi:DNA-binding NtrC family response regulator